MKKVNFKLNKNNKETLSHLNINAIENNNKLYFKVNDIKYIYSYNENKLIKETNSEKIVLDFNTNICTIELSNNYILNLIIIYKNLEKIDNKMIINYKVESEEEITNEIIIEYI